MDLLYLSRRDPVHVPVRGQELYVNPPSYHVKEGETWQPPRFTYESWMTFTPEEKRPTETDAQEERRKRKERKAREKARVRFEQDERYRQAAGDATRRALLLAAEKEAGRPRRVSFWDEYAKRNAKQREEEAERCAARLLGPDFFVMTTMAMESAMEFIAKSVAFDDLLTRLRCQRLVREDDGKELAD